jgi:hypothetical protein
VFLYGYHNCIYAPGDRQSFSRKGQVSSDLDLMIVGSNLGHYTKVFGAIIALSLAGKTGGRRKLRFFTFPLFALL